MKAMIRKSDPAAEFETPERCSILELWNDAGDGDLPTTTVAPNDVVIIPAGVPQSIANMGKEDLVFLCVCSPRFTPECYESL